MCSLQVACDVKASGLFSNVWSCLHVGTPWFCNDWLIVSIEGFLDYLFRIPDPRHGKTLQVSHIANLAA